MFLAAYLTVASLSVVVAQLPVDARAGENKLTQLDLKLTSTGYSFDWADAEDTVRGTIGPAPFRAGVPLTIAVSVQAQSLAQPMDGPITLSLRPLQGMAGGPSQTVLKKAGEKLWVATFTPEADGQHRVEIAWRSTHHKVVRGVFEVGEAGLPQWVGYGVGVGLIALAIGVGLWMLFGRDTKELT